MPFLLDLSGEPTPDRDPAVQVRILSDQAVSIVDEYGPAAVLTSTADALQYYLAQVQPYEPAGSRTAYEAVVQALHQMRLAVEYLNAEAAERLRL